MTDAEHRNVVTVEDGVTVEKALSPDDFAVPSVVLTIRGPEERRARVRVRDSVPDALGGGDIGFHPDHGGQFWSFDGDHVQFEREFDPGEEYTTIYGLATVDPEHDEWVFEDPAVEVLDGDVSGGTGTNADGSEQPGSDVPAQLARALERADPTEVSRIREALSKGDGTAPGRFRDEIDDLTETVDSLTERTLPTEVGEELSELAADLESIEARVTAMEERATPDDDWTRLAGPEELDAVRDDLSELRAFVDEMESGKDRNARDIGDVGTEVAELTSTVESLAADLPLGDVGRLDDLERSVEEIRAEIETVVEFRERIRSTLLEFESH